MEAQVSKTGPHSLLRTSEQTAERESPSFPAGLKTAWEEFYRSQTERLFRIASRMGVPHDRIADVLQEVWLAALGKRDDFVGEDVEQRLSAWLAGVTRNKSMDVLRRLSRRREESLEYLPAQSMDRRTTVAAALTEAKERTENLASELEVLQKEQSLNCYLVCQHVIQGRLLGDLAAETGLGINAISCRIRRALSWLRCRLEQ